MPMDTPPARRDTTGDVVGAKLSIVIAGQLGTEAVNCPYLARNQQHRSAQCAPRPRQHCRESGDPACPAMVPMQSNRLTQRWVRQ